MVKFSRKRKIDGRIISTEVEDTSKLDTKEINKAKINEVFPAEILKKILELLDIKNLVIARLTCKRWKLIIDNCNIIEEALSKILKLHELKDFAGCTHV